MIDYHVHIGQFNEIYYDAHEIFSLIDSLQQTTRINCVRFSSTSSCRDDVELKYIEEEIEYALSFNSQSLQVQPYFWIVPKYAEQEINLKNALETFDYCGIKIHPAGQTWDLNNLCHRDYLNQAFFWADENKKYVLIHCGPQKCDIPSRFENFYNEYKNAKIILAHSNPIKDTAEMLNKYENVFCDVSCVSNRKIKKLKSIVNNKKILFGSDFPITHYFDTHLFNKNLSLEEEYKDNCKSLRFLI